MRLSQKSRLIVSAKNVGVLLGQSFISVAFLIPNALIAADINPIEKKIESNEIKLDDTYIMGRVQLVGVIVDHSSPYAGIALIKDVHTGRTYAIKAGDNLPGVSHIVLNKVQREMAVFRADDKDYPVRLSFGVGNIDSNLKTAESNADVTQDHAGKDGPGLFESWAAGSSEKSMDSGSRDIINKAMPKIEGANGNDQKAQMPPELSKNSDDQNDSSLTTEDDLIED